MESTDALLDLLSCPHSPWRHDAMWSPQALPLRQLAVLTPERLHAPFIYNYFTSLRIVDRDVSRPLIRSAPVFTDSLWQQSLISLWSTVIQNKTFCTPDWEGTIWVSSLTVMCNIKSNNFNTTQKTTVEKEKEFCNMKGYWGWILYLSQC